MLWWLHDFLLNRKQQVRVGKSLSAEHVIMEGAPQGSALSPILFLLAIDPLLRGIQSPCAAFADDIALWVSWNGLPTDHRVRHLQQDLNQLARVAQVWGFSFNVKKSNQIIFRRSTRNSPQLVMHLGEEDTPLKEVKEVKYLGVTFDRSLSFKSHINTVARRCAQRLGLFRSFSTPYVGPSCNQMMLLYRALICPLEKISEFFY